jgi:hypothetical protein
LSPSGRTPSGAMDGECAFCGRADAATRQVYCQDCQTAHQLCPACAEEQAQTDAA